MANVTDINEYRALVIARKIIAEEGIEGFKKFQEGLVAYLELCEDLGLVPDDILEKYGSVKNL